MTREEIRKAIRKEIFKPDATTWFIREGFTEEEMTIYYDELHKATDDLESAMVDVGATDAEILERYDIDVNA